jgi:hypothetical protein
MRLLCPRLGIPWRLTTNYGSQACPRHCKNTPALKLAIDLDSMEIADASKHV